jgi:hypothetical protein
VKVEVPEYQNGLALAPRDESRLKPDIARGPKCVPKLDMIIPPAQRLPARDSTFSCEPCSH